jgi:hypothetical protein
VEPDKLDDFEATRDGFTVDKIHNTDIAGKRFRELSTATRQKILDYDFSVQVLPADTEDRAVLQIFGRMNSTGFKLNDQELRNAEFFGACKELMYKLAYEQLERWRAWRVFSETDIARMLEVEETSDIVITMISGVHGKQQKRIDTFYRERNDNFPQGDEVARRFRAVMDEIEDQLQADLPSLVFHRKPLFHTLFTFFYHLMFGLNKKLRRTKANTVPRRVADAVRRASERISSGNISEDLAKVLRGATGHLPAREKRLQFLQETFSRGSGN